ncbi:hypothetical protein EDD18DRAFT_1099816 [Armillaria luteobubalina]|uniref:Uncharacterized protein n=1 Tax=Armillaria luteobubalina TaxID=153913 RepID=A0AA39UY49_9AGAR|nr:hypothetical protein EDD18DRAFT_1099816 [Armillaria luteobubalina]
MWEMVMGAAKKATSGSTVTVAFIYTVMTPVMRSDGSKGEASADAERIKISRHTSVRDNADARKQRKNFDNGGTTQNPMVFDFGDSVGIVWVNAEESWDIRAIEPGGTDGYGTWERRPGKSQGNRMQSMSTESSGAAKIVAHDVLKSLTDLPSVSSGYQASVMVKPGVLDVDGTVGDSGG